MKEYPGVIFILLKPDQKMLLQLRDEYCTVSPLQWVFPGGASDNNESGEETVIREIKEEFDINIEESKIEFLTKFPIEINNVFICHISQDTQPILLEGKDMKWLSLEEIKNIDLGFNQNKFLPILEQYFIKHAILH